jgi:hemerythrin-like domain-containing protein
MSVEASEQGDCPMDMLTLLKQDHEEVKQQFEAIMSQDEIDRDALKQVCHELLIHAELEEKLLYPRMKKLEEAKEITDEAVLEHQEARKVIDEILHGRLRETKLKVKAEILQLAVQHHIEEEESDLFPLVQKAFSKAEIREIGEEMLTLKEKLAGKAFALQ